MIIDAHTHFYPSSIAYNPEFWAEEAGELYWGDLIGTRADAKLSLQSFPNEEKFLQDMHDAKIDMAIIQSWYWQKSETCEKINEQISDFSHRNPSRIRAFAAINPNDHTSCINQIRKAKSLGFIGIGELHNGVQNFDFLGDTFAKIANKCADEELAICLHLTETDPRQYKGKVPTDNISAFLAAKKFPHVKFIFAHWAGAEIFDKKIDKSLLDLPNIVFDSAATPLQFRGDTSIWSKGANKFPHKCVFGSDYPIRLYPKKFKSAELLTITSEAQSQIPPSISDNFFSRTISDFLNLKIS